MRVWTKWIWPGLVTTALLAALIVWFETGRIEADLARAARTAFGASGDWVVIELDGRDLRIGGLAPDEASQQAAVVAARSVAGVRTVRDMTGLAPLLSPYRLKGEKTATGVTLTGFVPTAAMRVELLDTVAAALPGIEITPRLEHARGAPAGLVTLAGFAVSQFGHLSEGRFEIEDETLSLSGVAVSPEDFEALIQALSTSKRKVDVTEIRPATAREPYYFKVLRSETALVLSGYAPSLAAREEILSAAGEAAGGGAVETAVLVAARPSARGDWTAIARQALALASDLASGEVSVNGGLLSIEGDARDDAAFARIQQALAGELPQGLELGTSDIGMRAVSP